MDTLFKSFHVIYIHYTCENTFVGGLNLFSFQLTPSVQLAPLSGSAYPKSEVSWSS